MNYRVKESIGIVFVILIAVLFFTAIICTFATKRNYKESQEQYGTCTLVPIDCRFTESHEAIETTYNYSLFFGKTSNVHSTVVPPKYEVLYKQIPKRRPSANDDGITEEWHEVTKEEYEEALNILNK